MTEIILRKRAGRPGEVGLFVESPVFESEWQSINVGSEVVAECTVPATAKYRKFFHALCGLLAENCDWLVDKDDAKEKLLLECRHATYHVDRLRNKTEIRAKTTKNLSADQWIRLLGRARFAVEQKFLPGTHASSVKAEIEEMLKDRR